MAITCTWAVAISLIGLRTKDIPLALCLFGVIPAFRLMALLLGPLGFLPDLDFLWILSIAAIPGVMLWCLILGIVLLRRVSAASADRTPVVG